MKNNYKISSWSQNLKSNFLFVFFTLLSINNSFSNPKDIIKTIEQSFNLSIITDTSFVEKSWNTITYQSIKDTNDLSIYLTILHKELDKYPQNYIANTGLKKIIICNKLHYEAQNRAAIPDPYKNTLYLAIDSFYSTKYLVHVIHHELHHITEHSIWKDMYFNWRKWKRKNKVRFKYGDGGITAYEDSDTAINWSSLIHPLKGFVNLYSTLGQEEDRCEIVALLMKDEKPEELIKFCATDKRLRKKVALTIKLLDKLSIETITTKYWRFHDHHFLK